MKKITWIIGAAGAALLCACQATKTAVITGSMTDMSNDTLLAQYIPLSKYGVLKEDTIVMRQGAFTLNIENDTDATEVRLYYKADESFRPMDYIQMVVFPGEALTVTGNMDSYQVTGTDFQQAYNEAESSWKVYEDSIKILVKQALAMEESEEQSAALIEYIMLMQKLSGQMMDAQVEYVRQHPDSDVSLYLLWNFDVEMSQELLPTLTDRVKNGPLASLYTMIGEALTQQQAEPEPVETMEEGTMAPDFTLKDLNGNDLTLSSLRGKYVILDFWGSWCGWCIKGIPEMKKSYAKHKDKMEILGIACRDTEEQWREAVAEHQLPWLHVRNTSDPDVSTLYSIRGYPTKVIIDPEGKIIKTTVGESAEFYEYLDELLK